MKQTDTRLRKVVGYRNKAEELRTMANDFADEGRRHVLESLADDYERLAEAAEAVMGSRSLLTSLS